jgi:hypothetical protein
LDDDDDSDDEASATRSSALATASENLDAAAAAKEGGMEARKEPVADADTSGEAEGLVSCGFMGTDNSL